MFSTKANMVETAVVSSPMYSYFRGNRRAEEELLLSYPQGHEILRSAWDTAGVPSFKLRRGDQFGRMLC